MALRNCCLKILLILFISHCAGSSLLHCPFLSCGELGLLSSCSVQASHCGGFSCEAWALGNVGSVVAAPRLQSTGSIVVYGLSYFTAHRIFLDQGLNPYLLLCQTELSVEVKEKPAYTPVYPEKTVQSNIKRLNKNRTSQISDFSAFLHMRNLFKSLGALKLFLRYTSTYLGPSSQGYGFSSSHVRVGL